MRKFGLLLSASTERIWVAVNGDQDFVSQNWLLWLSHVYPLRYKVIVAGRDDIPLRANFWFGLSAPRFGGQVGLSIFELDRDYVIERCGNETIERLPTEK